MLAEIIHFLKQNKIKFLILRSEKVELSKIEKENEVDIWIDRQDFTNVLEFLKSKKLVIVKHLWPHTFVYIFMKSEARILKLDIVDAITFGRFIKHEATNIEKHMLAQCKVDQENYFVQEPYSSAMRLIHVYFDKHKIINSKYLNWLNSLNANKNTREELAKIIEPDFPKFSTYLKSNQILGRKGKFAFELQELIQRPSRGYRLSNAFKRFFYDFKNFYRGKMICIVGADGAGKTTLATTIAKKKWFEESEIKYLYMGHRAKLLPIQTIYQLGLLLIMPYIFLKWPKFTIQKLMKKICLTATDFSQPTSFKSFRMKVFWVVRLFDILVRYYLLVWPQLIKGKNMVLDRSFYDLFIESTDFDLGGIDSHSKAGSFILQYLIPKADLLVCLWNEPENLYSRSKEHNPAILEQMQNSLFKVVSLTKNSIKLKSENHPEILTAEVLQNLYNIDL